MERCRIFSIAKTVTGYEEVIVFEPYLDEVSGLTIYPVDIGGLQCNIHYSTKVPATADAELPTGLLQIIGSVLDDYNL